MTENQEPVSNVITVNIEMEEGEPLGAFPNNKLVITRIQENTIADGKLKVGDQIIEVNGYPVNENNFFKVLRFAPPSASFKIIRDEKKAEELNALDMNLKDMRDERAQLIQRRDGFTYFNTSLKWVQNGPKLGLGIKHYQNRVLVSRADAGSLAAECLQVGDHIINIDGCPVTDKDVARDMLIKILVKNGVVSCLIERPKSIEAKSWTDQALSLQNAQPPSVQMNSDVLAIAQKERKRLAEKQNKTPASILVEAGTSLNCHVKFHETIDEHMIASDNEGRSLKAVKR